MLTHMIVRNFALMEHMNVQFSKGITIFTGETGAGKSILMDAFSVLLGDRASVDYIRHGEESFLIEGVFDIQGNELLISLLEEKQIDVEEDQLLLSRSFNRQGKSTILANGQLIPLKTLREIGGVLADIHGQYSNQELLQPQEHHHYLDAYNEETKQVYETYVYAYEEYRRIRRQWENLTEESEARALELESLRRDIDEIEEAGLVIGEDKQIEDELQKMDNFEHLHKTIGACYESIYNGRYPLIDGLHTIQNEVDDLAKLDEELVPMAESLKSAYFLLEDAASSLDRYRDSISYDEERYVYLQERDSLLYSLKKKYGQTIEEILDYENRAQERLEFLEKNILEADDLERRIKEIYETVESALVDLMALRKKTGSILEGLLESQFKLLGLEKAKVKFHIEESDVFTALGAERIEILFAANTGEALLPLHKVASGGELARIALAFKTVFHRHSHKTLVFDEIDVGISGDIALQVAAQILSLGDSHQVFCITHLPQTACIAQHHYHLEKREEQGRTISTLTALSEKQHVEQIAKMMSGNVFSHGAMETAKDMISHFKVRYES